MQTLGQIWMQINKLDHLYVDLHLILTQIGSHFGANAQAKHRP
jgi:hypothetical protein